MGRDHDHQLSVRKPLMIEPDKWKASMSDSDKNLAYIRSLEDTHTKYYELIYAVGKKYPNENRHQTALRYILQAENDDNPALYADVRKPVQCPDCSADLETNGTSLKFVKHNT